MKNFLSKFIVFTISWISAWVLASDGEAIIQGIGLYSNVAYQKGVSGAPKYQIGDFAQGGVVIWVTQDGQHGLVAAIEDQPNAAWSTVTIDTGATYQSSLPLSTPNPPFEQYYAGWKNQNQITGH